jgi:hypothetical protein
VVMIGNPGRGKTHLAIAIPFFKYSFNDLSSLNIMDILHHNMIQQYASTDWSLVFIARTFLSQQENLHGELYRAA